MIVHKSIFLGTTHLVNSYKACILSFQEINTQQYRKKLFGCLIRSLWTTQNRLTLEYCHYKLRCFMVLCLDELYLNF